MAHDDLPLFQALADAPFAMTAHVVYTAWDTKRPGTLSPIVIHEIIRGRIGFAGALISDDLSMKALGGDLTDRAVGALAAGCDLALHCNGKFEEMVELAASIEPLDRGGSGALRPGAQALRRRPPEPADLTALAAELDALMARRSGRDMRLHSLQLVTVWILPVLFALTLHEAAHGYAAKLCGDRTGLDDGPGDAQSAPSY